MRWPVPLAIQAATAAVTPLPACTGYYTLERLGPVGPLLGTAAALAPAAAVADAAGSVWLLQGGLCSRLGLALSLAVLAAGAGLLAWVWR